MNNVKKEIKHLRISRSEVPYQYRRTQRRLVETDEEARELGAKWAKISVEKIQLNFPA